MANLALVQQITQALAQSPDTIGWDFEGCNLNAPLLQELAPIFQRLSYLNIANGTLGQRGARILAEQLLLPSTSTLLMLDVGNCRLHARGVAILLEALTHNTQLVSLDVNENAMRIQGARGVATLLQTNTTLQKLNIGGNKLGGLAMEAILKVLVATPSSGLKELQCYDNKLGLQGAVAFAHFLRHTACTTFALNLSNCGWGKEGEALLSNALQHTACRLTYLSLSANTLWPAVLHPQNKTVTCLDLDNSQLITVTAFQELAPCLTSLFLNGLTEPQGLCLATTLCTNTTLTHLMLEENCQLYDTLGVSLAHMLLTNTTLVCLQATPNAFSDVTADQFATALRRNPTLKELRLFHNDFNRAGAVALAQALEHNHSLVILSIRAGHYLISDVEEAFSHMLMYNTMLRELYIDTMTTIPYNDQNPTPPMLLALQHNHTLQVLDSMDDDGLLYTKAQTQVGQRYLARNKTLYQHQTWHPSRHTTFATPLQSFIFLLLLLPYRSPLWAQLPTELIYIIAGYVQRKDIAPYTYWQLFSDEYAY